MTGPDCLEIERLRYWQGQRLLARDFRDQMKLDAHLRWWHNRALHQAYGVRYGFSVSNVVTAGELVAVRVGCGVAYDCFGRELILRTSREIALPNSGPKTLLARYRETAELPESRDRSNACLPGAGAVSLHEPELLWQSSAEVTAKGGVPLARLSFERSARLDGLPHGVEFPVSLARKIRYDAERNLLSFRGSMSAAEENEIRELSDDERFRGAVADLARGGRRAPVVDTDVRLARPLARPRVASGSTVPEGTAWELWSDRLGVSGARSFVDIGMQVTVDTSAAGFTETPCYFASLQGTLWSESNVELFPVPLAHIDRESIASFRLRLWMPPIVTLLGARTRNANQRFASEFINFARKQRLHVCWIGIQPAANLAMEFDCPDEAEDECPRGDEG